MEDRGTFNFSIPKRASAPAGARSNTVRVVTGCDQTIHSARYLWAQLLARIYGVFALKCSGCGGRVRLVGLITEPTTVRQILEHEGEPTSALAIAAARSPPLEMKIKQQLFAPEAVIEAIPELEFEQTEGLALEAAHNRLVHNAGVEQNVHRLAEEHFVSGYRCKLYVWTRNLTIRQTWIAKQRMVR